MPDQGTVQLLVHYMGLVVRSSVPTEWERSFAASIVARSRKPGFAPTDKQITVMQRLADKFRDASRDDMPMTEGDGARG